MDLEQFQSLADVKKGIITPYGKADVLTLDYTSAGFLSFTYRIVLPDESPDIIAVLDFKNLSDRVLKVSKVYTALESSDAGEALVVANLSNRKGTGKYKVCSGLPDFLEIAAYNDYEKMEMPPGASVQGEPLLLSFRERGVQALEQFGTLAALENGVNAAADQRPLVL